MGLRRRWFHLGRTVVGFRARRVCVSGQFAAAARAVGADRHGVTGAHPLQQGGRGGLVGDHAVARGQVRVRHERDVLEGEVAEHFAIEVSVPRLASCVDRVMFRVAASAMP